jgi:hypothetical protein
MSTTTQNQNQNQNQTLFNKTMSLHIPHIFPNVTKEMIANAFTKWELGKVSHVDIVQKKGKQYNMAFVHFDGWFEDSLNAVHMQERIKDPSKVAKLVYNDPKYWILCEYKPDPSDFICSKKEEDEFGLTEIDYLRMEEFEIKQEEEETYEDYAEATKDGLTLEDLLRCDEYFEMEEFYFQMQDEYVQMNTMVV